MPSTRRRSKLRHRSLGPRQQLVALANAAMPMSCASDLAYSSQSKAVRLRLSYERGRARLSAQKGGIRLGAARLRLDPSIQAGRFDALYPNQISRCLAD